MKRTLVIDYNKLLLQSLKDRHIIVKTDTLEQIESQYSESQRNNIVMAMWVSLPFTSISNIEFKQEWAQIPIIIYAYNIGNYGLLFSKVDIIRSLNIRLYLSNESETVFTDLKIMSSLGVNCGLYMKQGIKMNDDSFLDLASYYFMSPVAHATIEPFAFILRHLTVEKNEGFENVYFQNSLYFANVNSNTDLEKLDLDDDERFSVKLQDYYKHFIELDACSKCVAFKICNRKMMSQLDNCQTTMAEVYEYAELRNEMNRQIEPQSVCLL